MGRKFSAGKRGSVARIGDLVFLFLVKAVNVVVCVDGEMRHHSKKACIQRLMKKEQAKFDYLVLREKLMQAVEESRDTSVTQGRAAQLQEEIKKYQTAVQTKEKQFNDNSLPSDFVSCLQEEIEKVQEAAQQVKHEYCQGATCKLLVALTQADWRAGGVPL